MSIDYKKHPLGTTGIDHRPVAEAVLKRGSSRKKRNIETMCSEELKTIKRHFTRKYEQCGVKITAIKDVCSEFKLPQCQVERFVAELR